MKNILKLLLVFFLLILYAYTLVISNLPDNIVIFEGEKIKFKSLLGLNINYSDEIIQTSSSDAKALNSGKTNIEISLFDNILLKNINVDVLKKTKVIPAGNIAGVKLYTSGVLVVGMTEIEGEDNKKYKPYEYSGIKEGDRITSINEIEVLTTNDLIEGVNSSKGESINIKYIHGEETKQCSILPVKTKDSEYKIGLWVRDSAAGVGTVTFYDKNTRTFGALGHGITDIDTGELINISSGEFITTRILNISKGKEGNPGKIQGTIENGQNIGKIYKNTKYGIYGSVNNLSLLNIDTSKEMEVALRNEITLGKATILCNLDNQNIKEYEIELEKIYKENNYNNKSMEIRVTDKKLIEKTGGIIQGMSGSPIIQNGKFIGAITHVLVSNPEKGYAVFADMMIKQMRGVK